MAQDTNPDSGDQSTKPVAPSTERQPDAPAPTRATDQDDDYYYHYYSGGEIKELAGTRVPPALWIFWGTVVIICVFALVFAGALGPKFPLNISHIKVAGAEIGN